MAYIQLAELSYSGVTIPTDALRKYNNNHSRVKDVRKWKSVLGIAENI